LRRFVRWSQPERPGASLGSCNTQSESHYSMRPVGRRCWQTRCAKLAARSRRGSAPGPTPFSLPADRSEDPGEGRPREWNHFRRRWANCAGPERSPGSHWLRARPSVACALRFRQPLSRTPFATAKQTRLSRLIRTGRYRSHRAGQTGRNGGGALVGAERHSGYRGCARGQLRTTGWAAGGDQRRRRSQTNSTWTEVVGRLNPGVPLIDIRWSKCYNNKELSGSLPSLWQANHLSLKAPRSNIPSMA